MNITTHILDTSTGVPAMNVKCILSRQQDEQWVFVAGGITNKDGRIADFKIQEGELQKGIYQLKFETGEYFRLKNIETFYPFIKIIIHLDSGHYHVPLLLSPYGYSTYKGS